MARYVVGHRFANSEVSYVEGTTVQVDDDDFAEWINRCSPGTLVPEVVDAEPVEPDEDEGEVEGEVVPEVVEPEALTPDEPKQRGNRNRGS